MRNQTVWALQHRCKQETKRFGSCNNVANKKPNGLGLATSLQTGNQMVWALQHRCKQETKWFGSCNNVANKKPNGSGLATTLQRY